MFSVYTDIYAVYRPYKWALLIADIRGKEVADIDKWKIVQVLTKKKSAQEIDFKINRLYYNNL